MIREPEPTTRQIAADLFILAMLLLIWGAMVVTMDVVP